MNKIDLTPPAAVAKEAERGLKLREQFGRGGTEVGIARARDLKNRRKLTPETIMRMVSFFARHEVDKKGKNFYNSEKPSNGHIAWALWGGDVGRDWAEKMKKLLNE
ncbi:MAG: hypothetical protein R3B38_02795 [Patescibacteria group bacterium]